jgi:hypothetical protein
MPLAVKTAVVNVTRVAAAAMAIVRSSATITLSSPASATALRLLRPAHPARSRLRLPPAHP